MQQTNNSPKELLMAEVIHILLSADLWQSNSKFSFLFVRRNTTFHLLYRFQSYLRLLTRNSSRSRLQLSGSSNFWSRHNWRSSQSEKLSETKRLMSVVENNVHHNGDASDTSSVRSTSRSERWRAKLTLTFLRGYREGLRMTHWILTRRCCVLLASRT